MKIKTKFTIPLFFLCLISLTACLGDDESRDKIERMNANVSAFTCISGALFGSYPIEGMLVKIGNEGDYNFLVFEEIQGFTYHRGSEYELQIERITLANPPADAGLYDYRLVKELAKQEGEGKRTDIHLFVSAEVGFYKWGNITQDIPSPGMKIREKTEDGWSVVPFNRISGFQYEKGYDYKLSVKKIELSAKQIKKNGKTPNMFYMKSSLKKFQHIHY